MSLRAGKFGYGRALAVAVTLLMGASTALAQDMLTGAPPLTIQAGTYLTVRMNEAVSSDQNHLGDFFSAELTEPVVVKGIVVARPGQRVTGQIVDSAKAGTVSGNSRLGITLTSLTLVDGQNIPIRSQLMVRNGRPAVDRDAGALIATTATGAAIGGFANYGKGAAIGAGLGAAAGTVGVLLTRGYSTVVYPETLLTFQVTAPVSFSTDDAPQAFRAVTAEDYAQPEPQPQPQPPPQPAQVVVPPPPVYVYPYPYPYLYGAPVYPYFFAPFYGRPFFYGRPYYGGPSVSFYFGSPRYYGYRSYHGYRSHGGYRSHYGGWHPPRYAPHYWGGDHRRGGSDHGRGRHR